MYGRGHSHDDAQIFLSRLYYRGQRCEELEREYLDVYWQIDEAAPRIRRLPDSKLVHVRELYTTQELQTSTAYNELVPRVDSQNGLRVRLDGPYGTRIVWGVADSINGGDWSLAQIESIEYILPHLRQYVSFRQALVDAEALGTSLTGLLDNSRSGVIQLDWRGQIVAANDASPRPPAERRRAFRTRVAICGHGRRQTTATFKSYWDAHYRASAARAPAAQ